MEPTPVRSEKLTTLSDFSNGSKFADVPDFASVADAVTSLSILHDPMAA